MACSGVAEYFAGKSVFITGATGFMGKVLVEKLLRSCPDLKTLYLLMRSKRGIGEEQRLQEFVNCEVFKRLQAESPKSLHKLRLVCGDVLADQLGISILNLHELQEECQIVFHCAATVRFDQFIKEAVEINVGGTLKVLKLAESMKKLEVFLHMSTAYCHDYLDVLEEQLYPANHNPRDVLQLVRWMEPDTLKAIEEKLIHPLPNTYVYTKALAEDLVAEYIGRFTIAIARPSIVTPAYQEPMPGWVDNLNGPTGLLVAGAKGVFRITHTDPGVRPDILTVDVAVNATILLAYTTGLEQPKDIRVCNITNSGVNTITWVALIGMFEKYIQKYPFSQCIWYPNISYHTSKNFYVLHALFVHWLPALLIDLLLLIFRKKPFMIKVQKRLHHGLELMNHYMTGSWVFKNDYFLSLRHRLTEKERQVFFTEFEKIDQPEYIDACVQGTRKYCCKDPLSTLPRAKRLLTFLYYLQLTFKMIFLWWFLNLLYSLVTRVDSDYLQCAKF